MTGEVRVKDGLKSMIPFRAPAEPLFFGSFLPKLLDARKGVS